MELEIKFEVSLLERREAGTLSVSPGDGIEHFVLGHQVLNRGPNRGPMIQLRAPTLGAGKSQWRCFMSKYVGYLVVAMFIALLWLHTYEVKEMHESVFASAEQALKADGFENPQVTKGHIVTRNVTGQLVLVEFVTSNHGSYKHIAMVVTQSPLFGNKVKQVIQ
jgi:hypothetical protein